MNLSLVAREPDAGVCVLRLQAPPVNGLSLALRRALMQALDAAEADDLVQAVVLTGGDHVFCGGADIREFGHPDALAEPHLSSLIARVESFPKPVVMALHGTALGGGLELALGGHFRVAAQDAQLGLPEVLIGLLPGAGGTQRLPRALGLAPALEAIRSGQSVRAQRWAELPGQALLDRCVPREAVLTEALDLARWAAAQGPAGRPRLRQRSVAPDAAALARAQQQAAAIRGPAAALAVATVAASVGDFEAGLALERDAFLQLLASPEAAALRHAFFAERAAAKVPGIDAHTARRSVQRVAVIGAGTMGSGIATAAALAGLQVDLIEPQPEALARGLHALQRHVQAQAEKGRISAAAAQASQDRVQGHTDDAVLAEADLVIEAVFEDLALKQQVFRRLDAVCRPGCILATNTSTLDVDAIAAVTQRPADVLGLHFFSPAAVMKLLEVVRGAATAPEVLATALDLGKRLGKTCVVAGVCDGFIGNRMLEPYLQQALFLLDEGCTPQQVDAAIEAWGFAMGPFRMGDLAGNDVSWRVRQQRAQAGKSLRPQPLADALCERGRYGQKAAATAGGGWYDYVPGSREARPSAAVAELQARLRPRAPRVVSDLEIVQRLTWALAVEGQRLLAEGIALRASDVDLVYLSGYGFPRTKGGPLWNLGQQNPADVRAVAAAWAQRADDDTSLWRDLLAGLGQGASA